MNVEILSAVYGQGTRWVDVKNIVSDNINIMVGNDLFGDPSPNNLKQLKVEYLLDGKSNLKLLRNMKNLRCVL